MSHPTRPVLELAEQIAEVVEASGAELDEFDVLCIADTLTDSPLLADRPPAPAEGDARERWTGAHVAAVQTALDDAEEAAGPRASARTILRLALDALNGGDLPVPTTTVRAGDLARHVMDALDMPADVPDTRREQAAITRAIEGWFAAPPVPVETGDGEREGDR